MSDSGINTLSQTTAIDRIVDTMRRSEVGTAPFALVIGAGFSYGLAPTAKELVEQSLPMWIEADGDAARFEKLKGRPHQESKLRATDFWKGFAKRNQSQGLLLPLDSNTGFPEDHTAAYRAAFDENYGGAVGIPSQAYKFQQFLMRLDQPRLNASHFLLASLIGAQPRRSGKNELFKTKSAFCRLILTTNFDPFLQIALQSVNRLYFMSDTPQLGINDEVIDDLSDAIHLVYLHGSIHRRLQATTDNDIERIKKNSQLLSTVLKRRGVIVLGYSGWDDGIVEALASCDHFHNGLYWCGRENDPLKKGAFGLRVPDILRKRAAAYVQISSAGAFMGELCTRLVSGLPRLISNPVALIREMLTSIDLGDLQPIPVPVSDSSRNPQPVGQLSASYIFVEAQKMTIEMLAHMEKEFSSVAETFEEINAARVVDVEVIDGDAALAWKVKRMFSFARVASGLGNFPESERFYSEILKINSLGDDSKHEALMGRALALYYSGKTHEAQLEWTRVIELASASTIQVAKALFNRGVAKGRSGDIDGELADYTRIIEQLSDAPVDQVAKALINRGVTWSQKQDLVRAIADYTRVIEALPEAPVPEVTQALVNRGIARHKRKSIAEAREDYTKALALVGAPMGQVAIAFLNRGVIWDEQGNVDAAIADYTSAIEFSPAAATDEIARGLCNRGIAWAKKEQTEKALADFTSVINMPNAPTEQVALSLVNRGFAWSLKQNPDRALADYDRLIDGLHGAPPVQLAFALYNRGLIFEQRNESRKAVEDYSRLISDLPEAPLLEIQLALINRGWLHYQSGDYLKFLSDTKTAQESGSNLDSGAFNFALALLACGFDKEALTAYERACQLFPEAVETRALPDFLEATKRWLVAQRAEPVLQVLRRERHG